MVLLNEFVPGCKIASVGSALGPVHVFIGGVGNPDDRLHGLGGRSQLIEIQDAGLGNDMVGACLGK